MYGRGLAALLAVLGAFGTSSYYIANGVSGNGGPSSMPATTGMNAAESLEEGGGAMSSSPGVRCGRERWSVKTLTDADASSIDFTPIPSNITALGSVPAPASNPDLPRQPQEENVFTVVGNVVSFKLEDDHDIHLAIADPQPGPHPTMIAEFPDRRCDTNAVREQDIDAARAAFENDFGPASTKFQSGSGCVMLTGVFFFDKIHGQFGVAPNGAELHPVLDYKKVSCTTTPSAGTSTSTTTTTPTTSAPATTTTGTTGQAQASCTYRDGGALPDPQCTPGATNPDVTPATIDSTICKSGWTKTVRPPASVTGPQKLASMKQYGVGEKPTADYEYDHLISLELGGAPDDLSNLWPEPHDVSGDQGSFAKDKVENKLKRAICDGSITLAAAQHEIATDWRQAR
jgi:hypothetical protein